MNTAAARKWIFVFFFLLFIFTGCTTTKPKPAANSGAINNPESAGQPEPTRKKPQAHRIVVIGKAMEPTIKEKKTITYKSVELTGLLRGDVVVFAQGENTLIRRLIGLPGESVEIREGVIYINDQPVEEDHLALPDTETFDKITLASDEYFMMCDNPENRNDSRGFGPVKSSSILGRVDLKE